MIYKKTSLRRYLFSWQGYMRCIIDAEDARDAMTIFEKRNPFAGDYAVSAVAREACSWCYGVPTPDAGNPCDRCRGSGVDPEPLTTENATDTRRFCWEP